MLTTFEEASPIGWVILHFGAIGALVAVGALLAAWFRARDARRLGAVAIVLAVVCAALGTAGVVAGRRLTDREIARADDPTPIQRERMKQEGYGRAQAAARLGVLFAVLPLVAGTIALLVRPRRVDEDDELVEAMVEPWPTPRARALVLTLGALSTGVAAIAMSARVPSRGVKLDATAWDVLDALYYVQQSDDRSALLWGCRRLEAALPEGAAPPRTVDARDVRAADRVCVEERIQEAAVRSPVSRVRSALEDVARSSFVKREPDLKRPVEAALAEVRELEANPPSLDPEAVTRRGPPGG